MGAGGASLERRPYDLIHDSTSPCVRPSASDSVSLSNQTPFAISVNTWGVQHAFESDDGNRNRPFDSDEDPMDNESFFTNRQDQSAEGVGSGSGQAGGEKQEDVEERRGRDGNRDRDRDRDHARVDAGSPSRNGSGGHGEGGRVTGDGSNGHPLEARRASPDPMEAHDFPDSSAAVGHHRGGRRQRSRSRSPSVSRSPPRRSSSRGVTPKAEDLSEMPVRSVPLRSIMPVPQPPRISIPQPPMGSLRASSRTPSPKDFGQQRPIPPQQPRSPLTCGPMINSWRETADDMNVDEQQQQQQQQRKRGRHENQDQGQCGDVRRRRSRSRSPPEASSSSSPKALAPFSIPPPGTASDSWRGSAASKASAPATSS